MVNLFSDKEENYEEDNVENASRDEQVFFAKPD